MNHPMQVPLTKEELMVEVERLKKVATFWKTHWAAFYIVGAVTIYKMYSGWRTGRALGRLVNYVESKPEIMKATNPKRKTKKNPDSRNLYAMSVKYNRGGDIQKKILHAQAYSMSEARGKFQNILNKSLRDATLLSVSIEKT